MRSSDHFLLDCVKILCKLFYTFLYTRFFIHKVQPKNYPSPFSSSNDTILRLQLGESWLGMYDKVKRVECQQYFTTSENDVNSQGYRYVSVWMNCSVLGPKLLWLSAVKFF